jgi:hypothetical protein
MADLLTPFREAAFVITSERRIVEAIGDTEHILGVTPDQLIDQPWTRPDADSPAAGLYWAVETHFVEHVAAQFVPSEVAYTRDYRAMLARQRDCLIIKLTRTQVQEISDFAQFRVRFALNSVLGFTDVIRKGIDGPLTDLQFEDLELITQDARLAMEWLEDLRMHYLYPSLVGPVPILSQNLLTLTPDDLPRRRLARQYINVIANWPQNLALYSNGAVRLCIVDLVHILVREAAQGSRITLLAEPDSALGELQVRVNYQPIENYEIGYQEPVALLTGGKIRRSERLLAIVSSMHARLTPYGCRAWADSDPGYTTITLTAPLWRGPL